MQDWKKSLLKVARVLVLSALLGIPLSYIYFQTIFPSVSVPLTERFPSWLFILTVFALGFLAGILSDSLESIAVQSILSVLVGLAGAYFIFTSPVAAEEVTGGILSQFFFVIVRMVLPLVILAIILLFMAGFFGQWLYRTVQLQEPRPSIFDRGFREEE
jgi:hypothetical protein